MIIRLSKHEQKTLSALNPRGKGPRAWQTAREIAGVVFSRKAETLKQNDVRYIRNALRKTVREGLIEMNPSTRGKYRITDRGKRLLSSGDVEFNSRFTRGEVVKASKEAGQARKSSKEKSSVKKATTGEVSKQKAKTAAKKISAKSKVSKAKDKPKAKPKPNPKAKVVVVDKTDEATEAKSSKGGNGAQKKPKFKRRQAVKYSNNQSSED